MATQTALFNPNTGQPLYVGQTATFNGITYTGSTPVKTTSTTTSTAPKTTSTSTAPASTFTSTSTPKPTGISSITSTLTVGSQGDQVKALQQYLSGLGYTNADGTPLKVDGIYGSNTKTAVTQFQSQNGLTADGIFGPKSLAGAQNLATTSATANTPKSPTTSPYQTGNTSNDALLGELQNYIQSQQAQGLKINPNLQFTPDMLNQFLDQAKSQVHPYYQSQIDAIKQDVQHEAPQILSNYNSSVDAEKQNFTKNLGDSRNSNANNGLAYSGFRGQDEQALQNNENRTLNSLNQNAGNSLYNLGRGAEQQIGASNMNGYTLPGLSSYSASLTGNGGLNQGGTTSPYTPGGYGTGTLQYDEAAATEARRQALANTASSTAVNTPSYQNLTQ